MTQIIDLPTQLANLWLKYNDALLKAGEINSAELNQNIETAKKNFLEGVTTFLPFDDLQKILSDPQITFRLPQSGDEINVPIELTPLIADAVRKKVEASAVSQKVFDRLAEIGLRSADDIRAAQNNGSLDGKLLLSLKGASKLEADGIIDTFQKWGVVSAQLAEARAKSEKWAELKGRPASELSAIERKTIADIDLQIAQAELQGLEINGQRATMPALKQLVESGGASAKQFKIYQDNLTAQGQAAKSVVDAEDLKGLQDRAGGKGQPLNMAERDRLLSYETNLANLQKIRIDTANAALGLQISEAFQPFALRVGSALSGGGNVAANAVGAVLGSSPPGSARELVASGFGGPRGIDPGNIIGMVSRGDLGGLKAIAPPDETGGKSPRTAPGTPPVPAPAAGPSTP